MMRFFFFFLNRWRRAAGCKDIDVSFARYAQHNTPGIVLTNETYVHRVATSVCTCRLERYFYATLPAVSDSAITT